MSALSSRDRRALWLGAALVLPVLAWRVVLAPLATSYGEQQARLELTAGLLTREQALVRDSAAIGAALRAARARFDDEARALVAAGDSVGAMSATQATLRAAARAANLAEVSIETNVAPGPSGVLFVVDADVRARGSVAALADWLDRVERGDQPRSVTRLEVTAGSDELLSVSARVRGFVRREVP